jgi:hypothetical protein
MLEEIRGRFVGEAIRVLVGRGRVAYVNFSVTAGGTPGANENCF